MLLVIDVGNTNIMLGVFSPPVPQKESKNKYQKTNYLGTKPITYWKISTHKFKTVDEYGIQIMELFHYVNLTPSEIKGIIISSVVPSLIATFEQVSTIYFKVKPFIFKVSTESGMPILCDNPKEVGTDRIANAFAAFKLYKKPAIIVDFGTATTFDVVTNKGEYAGGVITAGIGISAEALFKRTSKLPYVDIVKPNKILGKNTIEGMQSGLINGLIGQTVYIINQLKKELKYSLLIIATGGYVNLIGEEIKAIKIINPTLTLEGLALIYERNIQKSSKFL